MKQATTPATKPTTRKAPAAPLKRAESASGTFRGMTLSPYQQRFLDWLVTGQGNGQLIAVAGAGKTTTLLAGAHAIPSDRLGYAVVFNKRNADELRAKFPSHMRCGTFHALWMQACRAQLGKGMTVDERKTMRLMQQVLPTKTLPARNAFEEDRVVIDAGSQQYVAPVRQIVALAKHAGVGALCADDDKTYAKIIDHYAIELDEMVNTQKLYEYVRKVLALSQLVDAEHAAIDFDDMLYLPVLHGWSIERREFVFVDEAQDTNAVQRELVSKMLSPTGRAVFVGDPHQAIYGFRGATNDAMSIIGKEFNTISLPLTVSYRCPQAIVAVARTIVDHIEAHPSAAMGVVDEYDNVLPRDALTPECAIVCRTTAPLVSLAFRLIGKRIGCKILGRDIGERLRELVVKTRAHTLVECDTRLYAWLDKQIERAKKKDDEALAQAARDKYESLMAVIESLPEGSTVETLLDTIDTLFASKPGGTLILCTVHKAKGLEWDTVTIIRPDLMPLPWVTQEWQKAQEVNIRYVAVTRAKQRLVFVHGESLEIDD